MTFEFFRRLIRRGEKETVDFKLQCNAFRKGAPDYEKANAELIKDICAMANNGSATSYLIIGIGDDGKTSQSVTNSHLTSQNVQTLARDSIHPRVNVRVHRLRYAKSPSPFNGITIVVIQIGPNARHAFRLARDNVNWAAKIHFRKHEVWRRNQDTSDLATPEQIIALVSPIRTRRSEPEPDFENVHYDKLTRSDQITQLVADVRTLFRDLGCKVGPLQLDALAGKPSFRACLKIGRDQLILRCAFAEKMTEGGAQSQLVARQWQLEHGVMVFLTGNFAPSAKFPQVTVDAKSDWGTFNVVVPTKIGWIRYDSRLPKGFGDVPISVLTLPRIRETRRMREAVTAMISTMESDERLFSHMAEARRQINAELQRWRKKSPKALAAGWSPYRGAEERTRFRQQLRSVSAFAKSCRSR